VLRLRHMLIFIRRHSLIVVICRDMEIVIEFCYPMETDVYKWFAPTIKADCYIVK